MHSRYPGLPKLVFFTGFCIAQLWIMNGAVAARQAVGVGVEFISRATVEQASLAQVDESTGGLMNEVSISAIRTQPMTIVVGADRAQDASPDAFYCTYSYANGSCGGADLSVSGEAGTNLRVSTKVPDSDSVLGASIDITILYH